MNLLAGGDLILANKLLHQCEPALVLDAPNWWAAHLGLSCRSVAEKLEVHSFTEKGSDAAALKKAAARLRNTAATIDKIIAANSTDDQP